MSEKLIGPSLQTGQNSLLNSLVPDNLVAGSDDLTKLFQQNQLALKNNAETTTSSLNDLKKQILSPNQKVKFDNTQMPISKLFDSCQGLYLNTQNAENKFSQATKNGIQLSDGQLFFGLKNTLTNIYSRSLKRLNDINIVIANYNKVGINANTKDPLFKPAYENLVKTKRLIEKTLDESKNAFYKTIEGLKTIEALKKIPDLKKKMQKDYENVLFWQKNVNSQKNLDSERINLKKYITQLEDDMSYGTKLASAIKNFANQPNQPDSKSLNDLIHDYEKKLVGPKKDSLTPPAPKPVETPKPQPTRTRRQNSVDDSTSVDTSPNTQDTAPAHTETLDDGEGNIAARDHIIERWGGYLRMRRADGGYFVWPTGRSNAYYKPRPRGEVPGGQCAAWVEIEIRNNPFYKDLKPIADVTTNTYGQKVAAVNTCPSPGNRPQIGGVVAIDTNYISSNGIKYGHIGFVHSINSDNSINVISSNAFGEATPTNQQFPSITTYPRSACVAFSRAPRQWH